MAAFAKTYQITFFRYHNRSHLTNNVRAWPFNPTKRTNSWKMASTHHETRDTERVQLLQSRFMLYNYKDGVFDFCFPRRPACYYHRLPDCPI